MRLASWFVVCCAVHAVTSASIDWTNVTTTLQQAIEQGVFPGCVAVVADSTGWIYAQAFGNFTYGDAAPADNGRNPPMTMDTIFDMASLTKIVATTSAVFQFYQRGEIGLHDKISQFLGDAYNNNGKEKIEVLNCMLHNAGYPPDPDPNYWNVSFGCPQTKQYYPAEDFSCQTRIYYSLLNQTLVNPVGEVFVYSDLSMITMMYVVGYLARTLGYVTEADLIPGCDTGVPGYDQCYYEAYVRIYVIEALKMGSSGFLPGESLWSGIAPTWNDTWYRHQVIQGTVSDGNSYALGGIAGHAGLFSTVSDSALLLNEYMFGDSSDLFGNRTTVELFTTVWNATQSSRALGWDTNAYSNGLGLCGNLSSTSYTHTGYTGTQFCCDPVRNIYTILFTNRVYPNWVNFKIEALRVLFNNAVKDAWDAVNGEP